MLFNGLDTLWDWNDIITWTLEFGIDIPLCYEFITGVWDGYTLCCDRINDTVPVRALAPLTNR